MRRYQKKEAKKTKKIICNRCGREIRAENGSPREEIFSVEWKWGYFSGKDGETHSFNLCENCYDEWIREFTIPVTVKE